MRHLATSRPYESLEHAAQEAPTIRGLICKKCIPYLQKITFIVLVNIATPYLARALSGTLRNIARPMT